MQRVGKYLAYALHAFAARYNVQLISGNNVAKPPEIVHAQYVVGVPVRQNKQVYPFDFILQALYPEFLPGVYLYVMAGNLYMGASARAPIPRIFQIEALIARRYYGNTLRSSRPHENYFHLTVYLGFVGKSQIKNPKFLLRVKRILIPYFLRLRNP